MASDVPSMAGPPAPAPAVPQVTDADLPSWLTSTVQEALNGVVATDDHGDWFVRATHPWKNRILVALEAQDGHEVDVVVSVHRPPHFTGPEWVQWAETIQPGQDSAPPDPAARQDAGRRPVATHQVRECDEYDDAPGFAVMCQTTFPSGRTSPSVTVAYASTPEGAREVAQALDFHWQHGCPIPSATTPGTGRP